MGFHTTVKRNKTVKFAGKWIELEKHYTEEGNLGTEKQMSHVLFRM